MGHLKLGWNDNVALMTNAGQPVALVLGSYYLFIYFWNVGVAFKASFHLQTATLFFFVLNYHFLRVILKLSSSSSSS